MTDTITMPREVVEQALEALKNGGHMTYPGLCKAKAAGDALEAALSAAAEPVKASPMFYVRLLDNNLYEGPIHHTALAKQDSPSNWSPLILGDGPASPSPAPAVPDGIPYRATLIFDNETKVVEGAFPVPDAAKPDRDGNAFRTAARLGLTLRFYGGCAQSGMPGSPSAYEVVSGADRAESMRQAVNQAADVITRGGEAQKLSEAAKPETQGERALLEAVAKAIYQQWFSSTGYVKWQEGGNSDKQEEARDIARAALLSAGPAPVKREGLTIAQRFEIVSKWRGGNWTVGDIIDAVEAANGIGGEGS